MPSNKRKLDNVMVTKLCALLRISSVPMHKDQGFYHAYQCTISAQSKFPLLAIAQKNIRAISGN